MRDLDGLKSQVESLTLGFLSDLVEVFVIILSKVDQLSQAKKTCGSEVSPCVVGLKSKLFPKRCLQVTLLNIGVHVILLRYSFVKSSQEILNKIGWSIRE